MLRNSCFSRRTAAASVKSKVLSATSAWRSRSKAAYTVPMPPSPTLCRIEKRPRPSTTPGASSGMRTGGPTVQGVIENRPGALAVW